jgi:hypothetical protein
MQVYSVIFKRVWRSMKEEFKKLHELNAVFLKSSQQFGTAGDVIRREDYSTSSDLVVPVADPHITSASQRVQQAVMVKQSAMVTPGYDKDKVERMYLRALRVDGIDDIYKDKVQAPPPEKVQVEQLKQKSKADALALKSKSFVMTLMENRKLNAAKIASLEAQAIKLMHDAKIDRQDIKLRAFDIAIKAMMEHNAMLTEQINQMQETDDDEGGSGDVGGVEKPSSVPTVVPPAPEVGAGLEGAMGNGEVPGGQPGGVSPEDGGSLG